MHNTESWYEPFYEITNEIFFSRITLKEGTEALIELIPKATPDGVNVTTEALRQIIASEIVEMCEAHIVRNERKMRNIKKATVKSNGA